MGLTGRRRFLAIAGGLAITPHRASAQRADRIPRIGFVSPTPPGRRDEAFRQGLRELGYTAGHNIHIEMRFAEGHPERLPGLVEELIRGNADVLVVGATIGARAAKKATTTIPIVFAGSSDPVAGGVVTNLARPGGNITGFSTAYGDGFAGKWLELLKEFATHVSQFAVLWSSSNAAATRFVKELEAAARLLGVGVAPHHATNLSELDAALETIAQGGAQGLIVTPSPFAATSRVKLVAFAASKRLPAIYFDEGFADAGGLMSYGPSIADSYRRAATYVDRILKGARPGDLPVQLPTKFDLVINLKTARELGLAIPRPMVLRADRVIE
jgi:putative tryptophan/tyrosine transport system substrate-binding protein